MIEQRGHDVRHVCMVDLHSLCSDDRRMGYETPEWFEKMPSLRGDPQEIIDARIERHNELRRRDHLIRKARRILAEIYRAPSWRHQALWLAQAAELRREAAAIASERPSE